MGLESATYIDDLNTSNPVSTDTVAQGDDHIRLLKTVLKATFPTADHPLYFEAARADLASATTPDLGAETTDYVNITGTTTITGFATAAAGITKLVRFDGSLTLTHNATSLILPSGGNLTTGAGDHALFRSLGSGNWLCVYYVDVSVSVTPYITGAETQVTARKGDLAFFQDISDSNNIKRGTAQSIAETGRVTAQLQVFDTDTDCETGDAAGDLIFVVPSWMNGYNLIAVEGGCGTAGTTGSMTVQVHNVTDAADMLSSLLTFTSGAAVSQTSTVNTSNDDIATGDRLRIDVDATHSGTAAKGLYVNLTFERPAS